MTDLAALVGPDVVAMPTWWKRWHAALWFEKPAEALSDPARFVAYALARAMHEDMKTPPAFVTDDDLREVLDLAPPGSIDPRR